MGTAIISCVECSQVAGLIQKVGRDSSKSTVSHPDHACWLYISEFSRHHVTMGGCLVW